MKAEVDTFPVGGAQGHPVIRLNCEDAFDLEKARTLLLEHRAAPGIWGVWLEGVDDWTGAELREFVGEVDADGRVVLAIRKITETVWPAVGCEFVLDASEAIAGSSNIRELATWLDQHARTSPVVQDLVVRIPDGWVPPASAALDMLAEFVQASCTNYLYLPPDYEYRSLLLRSVCRCGSRWAIR